MKTSTLRPIHRFDFQPPRREQPGLLRANAAKTAALGFTAGLSAWLLLAVGASADGFFFSTGNPDGKLGSLSTPANTQIQTETADDFVLTDTTAITHATFTGLIRSGASPASISNVEIEFYHVFPADSDTTRTPAVPTRNNSPADNEIADATRDGNEGSLNFTVTVLNASFSVANSVVSGIHPSPDQFTGGEGPVTGEEVLISVTFNPSITLPAGHYFFRPEALLSEGDFLWLSAPKPIVAPGTPFPTGTSDLQSWIRNDDLAPDWLRIGTDITHQGPFNAAFSLLKLAPCGGPASGGTWRNHGEYVATVAHAAEALLEQGLISQDQKDAVVASAAQSDCGT
jgi:hypothetical protein